MLDDNDDNARGFAVLAPSLSLSRSRARIAARECVLQAVTHARMLWLLWLPALLVRYDDAAS